MIVYLINMNLGSFNMCFRLDECTGVVSVKEIRSSLFETLSHYHKHAIFLAIFRLTRLLRNSSNSCILPSIHFETSAGSSIRMAGLSTITWSAPFLASQNSSLVYRDFRAPHSQLNRFLYSTRESGLRLCQETRAFTAVSEKNLLTLS